MIPTLIGQFWPYVAGAVALVVAYFGIKAKGGDEARRDMQAKVNEQAAQAVKEVNDVEAKINRMPDGAAADELRRKWMRK